MRLQELLDELRDNILFDRSDTTGVGSNPVLWSDATLIRYIDEAQRRFARKGFVIRDATTSEVCSVPLVVGQVDYVLHPAILTVLSARLDDSVTDLVRFGHDDFAPRVRSTTTLWEPTVTAWPTGRPLAYSTDEQLSEDDDGTISTVTLRVYPTPSAADVGRSLKLRVARMPLDNLTPNNLGAVPEIPADHHLSMLDWAAYLALRIVDTDAGNLARAKDFATMFEGHVAEARNLLLKKLQQPQQWGFGRGGWSWGAANG